MYSKLHRLQIELIVYNNDWGKLDFIRRALVTINGTLLDILK